MDLSARLLNREPNSFFAEIARPSQLEACMGHEALKHLSTMASRRLIGPDLISYSAAINAVSMRLFLSQFVMTCSIAINAFEKRVSMAGRGDGALRDRSPSTKGLNKKDRGPLGKALTKDKKPLKQALSKQG